MPLNKIIESVELSNNGLRGNSEYQIRRISMTNADNIPVLILTGALSSLTSEFGVLKPTVAAPPGTWRAGSCTRDKRQDWLRAKSWTCGERNTSEESSSLVRPGTSSPSTTSDERRWAPTPSGKCQRWFMMWLVICGTHM